ncbi:MAG: histidine phosphatase family protein [Candidatus Obscuribacterales bacterium]|nr:histidine phosphatase family protein [Candidatus Obscuribacterales bacterium]
MNFGFRLPKRVSVVRHARSVLNESLAQAIATGKETFHIPGVKEKQASVSEIGLKQITNLGWWLGHLPKELQPTKIITSKFRRARQTGFGAKKHSKLPLPRIDHFECLNERDWGVFTGLTDIGMKKRFPREAAAHRGSFSYRPAGGESRRDIINNRLLPGLPDLFAANEEQNLLMVTHTDVVICLRKLFEGMSEAEALDIHNTCPIPNCSVTSYVRRGRRFELEYAYFVAPEPYGCLST